MGNAEPHHIGCTDLGAVAPAELLAAGGGPTLSLSAGCAAGELLTGRVGKFPKDSYSSSRPIWAGKPFGRILKESSSVPVLTPKITHFQAKVLVFKGFWRNSGAQNGTLPLKTQGNKLFPQGDPLNFDEFWMISGVISGFLEKSFHVPEGSNILQ